MRAWPSHHPTVQWKIVQLFCAFSKAQLAKFQLYISSAHTLQKEDSVNRDLSFALPQEIYGLGVREHHLNKKRERSLGSRFS